MQCRQAQKTPGLGNRETLGYPDFPAPDSSLAGVVRVVVAGVMMVMVMMVRAGESRHSYDYRGKKQQRQKLFHAPDYSHSFTACSRA